MPPRLVGGASLGATRCIAPPSAGCTSCFSALARAGHLLDRRSSRVAARQEGEPLRCRRTSSRPARPMTLGLAFCLLVLTVPLAGGRLSRLEEVRIRWVWLVVLAFAIQVVLVTVVPEGDETLHRVLHVFTYGLAGACILRNVGGAALPLGGGARRPSELHRDRGERRRDAGVARRPVGRGPGRPLGLVRELGSGRGRAGRGFSATCSRSRRGGRAPTCSAWAMR